MKIYPSVRRILAVASGVINARSDTKVGIQLTQRFSKNPDPVNVGIAASQSPSSLRMDTKPGFLTSLLGAVVDAVKPNTNVGIAASQFVGSESPASTQQNAAFEIVQIKYDLNRRIGAATATEYAVLARTDYNAVTNLTGLHDALTNICTSDILGARSGGVDFTFADSVNKTDLDIVTVKLYFYSKVIRGLAGGATTVRNQWRKGASGAWTILETQAPAQGVTVDNLTSPLVYDITASIASWSDIDAIEASVECELASSATTCSHTIDAVELEIIATKTQAV